MRYFNYVVIVVVLIGAALWGRGSSPLPALQADLKASLDAFWQNQGTQVEVLGTPAQAEVRAQVNFPSGTGPRQQQWMNALIPFVARRHPGVKLGSVRVVPLATLAESKAEAAPPLESVAGVEGTQRTLQAQLDAALGPGQALILVDGQPAPEASENRTLSKRAPSAPQSLEGAPVLEEAAVKDRAIAAPQQPQAPPAILLAILVVQTKEDAAKASNLVSPTLNQVRVVLLP